MRTEQSGQNGPQQYNASFGPLAEEEQEVEEEMQEIEQGFGQPEIQMLGQETKSKFGNKEEKEKIGCLGRGI